MISKAVIPAAGLGRRFLPATRAIPKEMLPLPDIPALQRVVQEAVDSGIEDVFIITTKGKRAIEEHFRRSPELERMLAQRGDAATARALGRISEMANLHFIPQPEPKGLGPAIHCARRHVGTTAFAVLLGDTVFDSAIPATRQLIDLYSRYRATLIGTETVPAEAVSRYGIVAGDEIDAGLLRVSTLMEKPPPEQSPSNIAIAGRYILTPEIFAAIEQTPPGKDGEIQLTDALCLLLRQQPIFAVRLAGKRYDIGNPLDYLKAAVHFGLKKEEFAGPLKRFLAQVLRTDPEG